MNAKNKLKVYIYNAFYESCISEDEKEYLFNVTENAVGDIIRKVDFKKRYHYNSKNKTIVVQGETYRIDLDTKNPIVYVSDMNGVKSTPLLRMLSATVTGNKEEDSFIILNKNFFKVKGKEKREALLQHEVGHLKMHSLNTKSKELDKRFIHEDEINSYTGDNLFANIRFKKSEYMSSKKGTKDEINERDKVRKSAKKYEIQSNDHTRAREYEADRYSANRTSEEDLIDGLKQLYKIQGKKLDILKRYILVYGKFPTRAELNSLQIEEKKLADEDMKQRQKALKDEVLRNAKILKKEQEKDNKDDKK